MKKAAIITILFTCMASVLTAQEDVLQRLLLIGDAGDDNPAQKAIIADALSRNLPGKTTALFLGDNIYPRGLEAAGSKKITTENMLRSQFEALRAKQVPVYFIPGNHDWDKSGPQGYSKILAANAFISAQQDSLLRLLPEDACPGPYELAIDDNTVLVAMDSEWWLYPFDNHADRTDCSCRTKRDVLGKLEDILRRNQHKLVFFATHHPFKTYGVHGGYYTLEDHLFPLTKLNKNLYIPLPLLGSLYPLLRSGFPPAEDLKNALYKDMSASVDAVLSKHPNIIHVSGHEHSLQLIAGEVLQVVSGAGSRHTAVKKGRGSIFAAAASGYVVADVLKDFSIRLRFLQLDKDSVQETFIYTKAHTVPEGGSALTAMLSTADSKVVALKPGYDKVSKLHRQLFGENYRKVWAANTDFKVLQLAKAGLQPIELGGGMQTHSLRLKDSSGKEWVLRSINKFPEALLPKALSQTLAADILEDNFSSSFPYGPLVVPVIADALGVPHSNPSFVYIAQDKALGIYNRDFANTVALLEEREPLGKSLSTVKMDAKLKEDNDNSIDQQAFLRARIQDIFLGDWDRHGDQWRWIDDAKGKSKFYKPVPRDRDQAFYINRGLFPGIVALPWIQPKLQGFGPEIRNINTFVFNARFIDGIYTNVLSLADWQQASSEVAGKLTDSVIAHALQQLPSNIYATTGQRLFEQLQKRRAALLHSMPVYYRFINRTIDVITSDKNELVLINDTLDKQLGVHIYKITKERTAGKLLYSRILDPAITKELRLYINGGSDSVVLRNSGSPVTIRVVGDGMSEKTYAVSGKPAFLRKIHIYDGDSNAVFAGQYGAVHRHLSGDAANTAQQLTNRYNKTIPLAAAGFNADDGFLLSGGLKWIRQGFRKQPYASVQQFLITHSFSTAAYRFSYAGEWLKAMGNADLTLNANAAAPDNTQNFFGRGNATPFLKTDGYKRYYRTRFNYYTLEAAARWRSGKSNSFSVGPSFQYYRFSADDNAGRFINQPDKLHSYDSATIDKDKTHAGLVAAFIHDGRSSGILPLFGNYFNARLQGYAGLNSYSKSYLQFTAQLAFYRSLDRKSNIVLANRIGGGITAGKTTFYQSLFLGGQSNMLGFRQFRFAGEHSLYNNLELRIKLGDLASYILPGQIGVLAFYDIGKVWQQGYNDKSWHQGVGGGIYFAPAQLFVFQMLAGYSNEGWYPYFTAGFRF